MKARELREKTTVELEAALHAAHQRMSGLHFDLAAGRVKDVKEVSSLRREAARIKTLLRERERELKK